MPQLTWDHIHLRSPDPEATAQWFERMLGAQVIHSTQQGKPRIDLKLGGANIFIAQVSPGDGVNAPPTTPLSGARSFRAGGHRHRRHRRRAQGQGRRIQQGAA
jgi:lactoylglutathione lyase